MERCTHVSWSLIFGDKLRKRQCYLRVHFLPQTCRILSEVTLEVFQRAGLNSPEGMHDETSMELMRNATLNVHHVDALGSVSR